MDRGAWWAAVCGVAEWAMTERLSMHNFHILKEDYRPNWQIQSP